MMTFLRIIAVTLRNFLFFQIFVRFSVLYQFDSERQGFLIFLIFDSDLFCSIGKIKKKQSQLHEIWLIVIFY